MNNMTEKIRQQIRDVMTEQEMTTYRLAQMTGIDQPNVTRLLKGRSGKIPESWQKVLDALGLELIVKQKDNHA